MSDTGHTPTAAATAFSSSAFILVETCSGYRSYSLDTEAPKCFLDEGSSENEIGDAVLAALSRSRQISIDEIATFFNLERTTRSYADWITDLMTRYGYKTKRALFKGMKNCGIRRVGDIIKFEPMRQVKQEMWEGTASHGEDDVILPATSTPAEIGAAFRLALSRCR